MHHATWGLNVASSRSRVLRDDVFLTKQGLSLLLRPEADHSDGVKAAGKGVMKQTEFIQKMLVLTVGSLI